MSVVRLAVVVLVLAGLAAGGKTFSAFSKTTSNGGDRLQSARIFPRDRTVPAQSITDASSGTATDSSDQLAFADARTLTTSNAATTFATNRYIDVELAGVVPDALSASTTATAEIDFADNNADTKKSCMYFESRRISTNAVLNTWGSAASPLGCTAGIIPIPITQGLTAVTSAAIANDLKLRIFLMDEGAGGVNVARVNVRFVALGHTWTLHPVSWTDSVNTTPVTTPWNVAKADGTSWQNASTNWPASFNAARYVSFGFPDTVPASGVVSAASLEYRWANNAAGTHCFYFEVYSGTTLIGTHGSTSSGYCTSSTTQATNTVSLPEINTASRANNATVKLYVWGGGKTNFDLVALHHTYQLAPSGCVDSGTIRVAATRDQYTNQALSTTTPASGPDLYVRSDTTKNKRTFVWFPIPVTPSGCSLTSATLRLFQSSATSTRTVTADRVSATWADSSLTWGTQPAGAGTTVSADTVTGWKSWTVTSLVSTIIAGTNYGFVLKDATEGGTGIEQKYNALEATSNQPELLLTYG